MKAISLNNNFLTELKAVCKQQNFVILKDTGINLSLLKSFYSDWQQFFLSNQKSAYQYDARNQVGYYPLATEIAKDGTLPDYKECFHYYPLTDRCPANLLQLTNQIYSQFLALSKVLAKCLQQIATQQVQQYFTENLADCIDQQQRTLLRILHYPVPHSEVDVREPRAEQHEDICLFTLMPHATASGLEIQNKQGRWESIVVQPNEILLMFGEMLEIYSRGFFKAATHRVSYTATSQLSARMATAFFVHPRPDVQISKDKTANDLFYQRMQEINLL